MSLKLVLLFCLLTVYHCENLIDSENFIRKLENKFPGRVIKTPFIVGGSDATASQAPWQVSFGFTDGANVYHICGGSIISSKTVLTAAQCCAAFDDAGIPVSYLLVSYGGTDIGTLAYSNYLTRYTIQENYDPNKNDNDVCLLHLRDEVKFSSTVQSIALASSDPVAGTAASITGWGRTDGNDDTSESRKLQIASQEIIARDVCKQRWAGVTDAMICAGSYNSSVCIGDGGGPLVANNQLVGVISWGAAKCPSNTVIYPDVFADTAYFYDWILRNDPSISTTPTPTPIPSTTPGTSNPDRVIKITGTIYVDLTVELPDHLRFMFK